VPHILARKFLFTANAIDDICCLPLRSLSIFLLLLLMSESQSAVAAVTVDELLSLSLLLRGKEMPQCRLGGRTLKPREIFSSLLQSRGSKHNGKQNLHFSC
jgi:hypothetical protein